MTNEDALWRCDQAAIDPPEAEFDDTAWDDAQSEADESVCEFCGSRSMCIEEIEQTAEREYEASFCCETCGEVASKVKVLDYTGEGE